MSASGAPTAVLALPVRGEPVGTALPERAEAPVAAATIAAVETADGVKTAALIEVSGGQERRWTHV